MHRTISTSDNFAHFCLSCMLSLLAQTKNKIRGLPWSHSSPLLFFIHTTMFCESAQKENMAPKKKNINADEFDLYVRSFIVPS